MSFAPVTLASPSSQRPTPTKNLLADPDILHSTTTSALLTAAAAAPPPPPPLRSSSCCADIQRLLALSETLRATPTFPFSFTLELSTGLAAAWDAATACPQCRHNPHALLLMPLLAEQAMGVYEAAGVTYELVASSLLLGVVPSFSAAASGEHVEMREGGGGGGGGGGGSSSSVGGGVDKTASTTTTTTNTTTTATSTSTTTSLACVKSEMRLGDLRLDGDEAKLLARVALRRAVVKLGKSLEGLRALVSALWGEGWAQRTETLMLVEERAGVVIERLVRLLGMLR